MLNKEFINEVIQIISDLKSRYVALSYNRNIINSLGNSDIKFKVNDQMFLRTYSVRIKRNIHTIFF